MQEGESSTVVDAEYLRTALGRGGLAMVYQPKIDSRTGALAGVEALARWHDAHCGQVDPAIFIPLAETEGLIDCLTGWGLRTALDDWNNWREAGLATRLSFNISPLSLSDLRFPDFVENLCRERNIPTQHLTLELTESASQGIIPLADTLTRFRIKGMGLALDDFGTGFSSLARLRRLPFTEVKIDRCFVEDIIEAEDSRSITKAIIDLSHAMGMKATAEGVQCLESLTLLAALGCDEAQGDFISRPLPAGDVANWRFQMSPDQNRPRPGCRS